MTPSFSRSAGYGGHAVSACVSKIRNPQSAIRNPQSAGLQPPVSSLNQAAGLIHLPQKSPESGGETDGLFCQNGLSQPLSSQDTRPIRNGLLRERGWH